MIEKNDVIIAKKLFSLSFKGSNLNEPKVKAYIKSVKSFYGKKAVGVLRAYLKFLEEYERNSTLIIEMAEKKRLGMEKNLKRFFEKQTGKKLRIEIKENKSLLAGLRLTLGDNQWDYSVKGKISKLKETLNA